MRVLIPDTRSSGAAAAAARDQARFGHVVRTCDTDDFGTTLETVRARVYREAGRLGARLLLDDDTPTRSDASAVAVRATGALRALDPWAAGVDVSVQGPSCAA